jgi:predicted MFS family arabinose efflux permease
MHDCPANPVFHAEASSARIAAAGFIALAVAMGIGRFAFTPLLPLMQDDAGLSIADGGALASANYLGYLLGALAALRVRLRPETAVRAGAFLIGIVTLAMGLQHDFTAWLVLRGLAGMASAFVLIFTSAWCLDRLSRSPARGFLRGAVFAGVGGGIMAAGLLCLAFVHRHATSPEAWIALGTLSLVLSLSLWPLMDDAREVRERVARPATIAPPRGTFLRLVFAYGAFGFGYIIPATFLPAMAREAVSDPWIFGWAWPVFGAAALLSTLAASSLFRSAGRAWLAGHLVMAAGVLMPLILTDLAGIIASAVLVGATFMVVTMAGLQAARELAGEDSTRLMAAMTAAFALGQIAGPFAVTHLARGPAAFPAGLCAAAVLLVLGALALPRRSPSSK